MKRENADDTISRQAAINTVGRMFLVCDEGGKAEYRDLMVEALKVLPSAQPQLVRCKDCKLSPWRPIRYSDTAVEFTCCGFTRGPEGFCAWGERRKNEHRENMR